MTVARRLLVTIRYMLTEHTTYRCLRPASSVRKPHHRAYRIGRRRLPAPSSEAFVTRHRRSLGLHELAMALVTTGRNARLTLAASVT